MTATVTRAELDAAIVPVKSDFSVLRKDFEAHLDQSEADRAELRKISDWIIRAEERSETNGRWIKGLTGGTVAGFIGLALLLVEIIQRLGA